MDQKHLDDAHFYLREAFTDLQKAKYHLARAGVSSYSWFEKAINRMQTTVKNLLAGVVNRARNID